MTKRTIKPYSYVRNGKKVSVRRHMRTYHLKKKNFGIGVTDYGSPTTGSFFRQQAGVLQAKDLMKDLETKSVYADSAASIGRMKALRESRDKEATESEKFIDSVIDVGKRGQRAGQRLREFEDLMKQGRYEEAQAFKTKADEDAEKADKEAEELRKKWQQRYEDFNKSYEGFQKAYSGFTKSAGEAGKDFGERLGRLGGLAKAKFDTYIKRGPRPGSVEEAAAFADTISEQFEGVTPKDFKPSKMSQSKFDALTKTIEGFDSDFATPTKTVVADIFGPGGDIIGETTARVEDKK